MATSQNGWVAQPSSSGLASLEWITGRVMPGDVYTIFDYFCRRFHQSVEPIRRDHSWGWAYRDVRGASVLSNHASATAIDLNAPAHPLGRSGTFSPDQMRALRPLLNSLDGAVRWGGDYSGRKDEMHFEINAPRALVAAVAAKIRGAATGGSGGGLAPSPAAPTPTAPNPTPALPPLPVQEDEMFRIRVATSHKDPSQIGKVYVCQFGPTGHVLFRHISPGENALYDLIKVPVYNVDHAERDSIRNRIITVEANWKVGEV